MVLQCRACAETVWLRGLHDVQGLPARQRNLGQQLLLSRPLLLWRLRPRPVARELGAHPFLSPLGQRKRHPRHRGWQMRAPPQPPLCSAPFRQQQSDKMGQESLSQVPSELRLQGCSALQSGMLSECAQDKS
jgi:hypothetical protein